MSLIKVDVEKCNRDGICIAICPLRLLSFGPDGWPEVVSGRANRCIGCGHCVAACPSGALDNRKNPLAGPGAIPERYSPDPARSMLFLRSRRSIRNYKSETVSREKMRELLDIARFAPSAHNSQSISYLVVEGDKNLTGLREIIVEWMRGVVKSSPDTAKYLNMPAIIEAHERGEDLILREAPHLIVAHAPRSLIVAPVSTVLSLEYVELYAPALGIGTCWAGYAQRCAQQSPAFSRFLNIPADRTITGIMMVGHPVYKYHRLPQRNPLDVAWFE